MIQCNSGLSGNIWLKASKVMEVSKIAIIGSGPSGLVALNEFLHTSKDGISTIQSLKSLDNKMPQNPAFGEIILFEQNTKIGGTWNYSKSTDPPLPTCQDYYKPNNIRPIIESPCEIDLLNTSFKNPLIRPIKSNIIKENLLWNKSGVYDDLFTNVPYNLMRFSSGYDINNNNYIANDNNPYQPFIRHEKVLEYLEDFSSQNGLLKHIRFNSSVEKLYKKNNKWYLTIVEIDRTNNIEKWYIEKFDSVLIATGRFNIPFVPFIENLDHFVVKNPNSVLHTKAFRTTDDFKNKKVLLVGSSISAIDLLQYLIPKCKEVWLSSNTSKTKFENEFENEDENIQGKWMYDILKDENLNFFRCSKIKRFLNNKTQEIEFEDGKIIGGFDKILFATGYHLHYPFLEIDENKGKDYIKILSGKKDTSNYAHTKADNAFLYTFSIKDPTLCYSGIAHNPLLFFTAEANAIAIAGVWSNSKKLPNTVEQQKWCNKRLDLQNNGLQMFDEAGFKEYAEELYNYAPFKRLDLLNLVNDNEVENSRKVLKKLFYDISSSKQFQ